MVQRTDRGEVALTHAVLDGDALPELRIRQHIPGGGLRTGHQVRVIDDAGDAPHIAGGVAAPRLTVDLVVLEDLPKIRGHALDIVVVLVRRVEEVLGERLYLALADQLHKHVLGRADEIVGIAEGQHVVEILIGTEGGVLDLHLLAVGLLVPVLEVLHQRVFTEDIPAWEVNDFISAPPALVDVLLPVADAQRDGIVGLRGREGLKGAERWQEGAEGNTACGKKCKWFPASAAGCPVHAACCPTRAACCLVHVACCPARARWKHWPAIRCKDSIHGPAPFSSLPGWRGSYRSPPPGSR